MQATTTGTSTFNLTLGSGARELLKWIALLAMTGDHVAKVVFGGYVPVVSELGRIAFPLFALVMACNLAQPGADLRKSIRRLALWGLIAQPLHALAFGSWLPLNILLTFTLAVVAVHAFANNRPVLLLLAAGVLPMFVDYQWAGVGAVLGFVPQMLVLFLFLLPLPRIHIFHFFQVPRLCLRLPEVEGIHMAL